jgi:hypothetical protein
MPPMKKPSVTMMIASEIGPRITALNPPPPLASSRQARHPFKLQYQPQCDHRLGNVAAQGSRMATEAAGGPGLIDGPLNAFRART